MQGTGADVGTLTMSYQPGMRMPMLTVMGIMGALGNTKATSSNLPRRRHVSARKVLLDTSAAAHVCAVCRGRQR